MPMGLREVAKDRPKTTTAVVGSVLVLCVIWCVYNLLPEGTSNIDKAFYTDDDGKTYFTDSSALVPPFDHGGKVAVRAQVFTCSDRNTPFVGYVERYTPEIKRKLDESASAVKAGKPPMMTMGSPAASGGLEFKKPGETKWLSASNLDAKQKLFKSLCPSGAAVDSVLP